MPHAASSTLKDVSTSPAYTFFKHKIETGSNTGMQERSLHNRIGGNSGELVRAQSTLQELETKLEHLRGLLAERKNERRIVEARIHEIAANGDMDGLVALQSRA